MRVHSILARNYGPFATLEEVRTYCRILTALARSIEIQADIDDLYLAVEAKPATVEWA